MLDSFETAKNSISSLVKMTKDSNHTISEESLDSITQVLKTSAKTIIVSAENTEKAWKDARRPQRNRKVE